MFNVSVLLLDDALKQRNRLQRENVTFIEPDMWSPNSPDLNPVDYVVSDALQQMVSSSTIHDNQAAEAGDRHWVGENCPTISLTAPLVSGVASLTFHKVV